MTASRDAPSVKVQGTCGGYEIRSSLSFRLLRFGGGTPLHVEERPGLEPSGDVVATWEPRPGNPFHGRLLRDGPRFAFWASDSGWFAIDSTEQSIIVASDVEPVRRELRLFGIPTAVCASEGGDLPIHASAVDVGGQAVVIAGPSMYGKTTLAAGFVAAGHRLLAEDTVRCTIAPQPAVYPGPAVIRLRPDVARELDVPGTTSMPTQVETGRTPLVVNEGRRGGGSAVPLKAIVLLRTPAMTASLEPVSRRDAARDLFALAFRLPTPDSRASCFTRVVDIVARVDALALHRPLTLAALPEVVGLVERHLERHG